MRRLLAAVIVSTATAIALPSPAFAQSAGRVARPIGEILLALQDERQPVRAGAFYELLRRREAGVVEGDQIRPALIALLARETEVVSMGGLKTEEAVTYHGDLIAAVGALEDVRALPVLLANLMTGNMASRAVARLGGAGLDAIISLTSSSDLGSKIGAMRTLFHYVTVGSSVRPLTSAERDRIRVALLSAAVDESPLVRMGAVQAMGAMGGPEASPTLTRLADSDPDIRVREMARVALQGRFGVREAR